MPRPKPRPSYLRLVGPDVTAPPTEEARISPPVRKRRAATKPKPVGRVERRAPTLAGAVAPARSQYGWLVEDVSRWAFQSGRAHDATFLSLVLAARTESPLGAGEALTYWTKEMLRQVLTIEIAAWCSVRRVLEPEIDRAVLESFFDYLSDTNHLDPDSDPVLVLLELVRCPCDPLIRECDCNEPYYGPSHGDVTTSV